MKSVGHHSLTKKTLNKSLAWEQIRVCCCFNCFQNFKLPQIDKIFVNWLIYSTVLHIAQNRVTFYFTDEFLAFLMVLSRMERLVTTLQQQKQLLRSTTHKNI